MEFNSVDDLIHKLTPRPDKEATRELTKFFAAARFGLKGEAFERHFCDGKDDGGIDLFNTEGSAFHVVQSKFCAKPKAASSKSATDEIRKLVNTLTNDNPNRKADEFVNAFRRATDDPAALLEYIWLTTNDVKPSAAAEAQKYFEKARKEHNWRLNVDFVPFGRAEVQRLLSDSRHGYVPYTGKKELPISGAGGVPQFIENRGDANGVYSMVCNVRVTDLLKWIPDQAAVNKFLQKNVREYEGEKEINRGIQDSFRSAPEWFWYKHNGVIIFADSIEVSTDRRKLILRNPQIVNGGQTIAAIYDVFDWPAPQLTRVHK